MNISVVMKVPCIFIQRGCVEGGNYPVKLIYTFLQYELGDSSGLKLVQSIRDWKRVFESMLLLCDLLEKHKLWAVFSAKKLVPNTTSVPWDIPYTLDRDKIWIQSPGKMAM